MDEALKKKWIEALRSGKYKQGRYNLKCKDDSFCCLGVLCEVSKKGMWVNLGKHENYYEFEIEGRRSYESVFHGEFGLTTEDFRTLIDLNDSRNDYDFGKIADWIEGNV